MHTVTLDSVLDKVMLLESEQRDMLVEIVRNRQLQARREEFIQGVREGLAAYDRGELKPQIAEEIIKELHESLSGGFDFWDDAKEDLYQDYLPNA